MAFEAYIEAAKTWKINRSWDRWVLSDRDKPVKISEIIEPQTGSETFVMIPFSTEDAAKAARLRMILRDTLAAVANQPVNGQGDNPQDKTNSPGERG